MEKANCLFCKIINNEISASCIFEDEIVKVILDVNPASNGHVLIIPKIHYDSIMDICDETLIHIKDIIKLMYDELKIKLNCKGLTIITNTDLGQSIKHLHFHLIPRYDNDEIVLNSNKDILLDPKEIFSQLKKEN